METYSDFNHIIREIRNTLVKTLSPRGDNQPKKLLRKNIFSRKVYYEDKYYKCEVLDQNGEIIMKASFIRINRLLVEHMNPKEKYQSGIIILNIDLNSMSKENQYRCLIHILTFLSTLDPDVLGSYNLELSSTICKNFPDVIDELVKGGLFIKTKDNKIVYSWPHEELT